MKDKATLEITHFDIAVIEAMHDLMIDEAGYSLDCPTLQRARKLTNKMYAALGTTDPDSGQELFKTQTMRFFIASYTYTEDGDRVFGSLGFRNEGFPSYAGLRESIKDELGLNADTVVTIIVVQELPKEDYESWADDGEEEGEGFLCMDASAAFCPICSTQCDECKELDAKYRSQ